MSSYQLLTAYASTTVAPLALGRGLRGRRTGPNSATLSTTEVV